MKLAKLNFLMALGLVLVMGATGCKKGTKSPTPIPGLAKAGGTGIKTPPPTEPTFKLDDGTRVPNADKIPANEVGPLKDTGNGIPTGVRPPLDQFNQDRGVLSTDTVYFDFDRAEVKASERVKVEEVATYLKGQANISLLVEGHCDERGTEEYNRALGERRALAIREYLVNLGVSAERVFTISYGEDKPAVEGHTDAAWSKNRRGEFVVLRPKQ